MITLATLSQATAQDVFDQVVAHLRQQGKKSATADGESCQYRSFDGLKCAAGCLVSDDEYNSEMEGLRWNLLAQTGFVPIAHVSLIKALQSVHDDTHESRWESSLREVALAFHLKYQSIAIKPV